MGDIYKQKGEWFNLQNDMPKIFSFAGNTLNVIEKCHQGQVSSQSILVENGLLYKSKFHIVSFCIIVSYFNLKQNKMVNDFFY